MTTIQETSLQAYREIEPSLGRLERTVFTAIGSGRTCDELEEITGLPHQTVSARLRGLAKREVIADSGDRRPTRSGRKAVVWIPWRLTP